MRPASAAAELVLQKCVIAAYCDAGPAFTRCVKTTSSVADGNVMPAWPVPNVFALLGSIGAPQRQMRLVVGKDAAQLETGGLSTKPRHSPKSGSLRPETYDG